MGTMDPNDEASSSFPDESETPGPDTGGLAFSRETWGPTSFTPFELTGADRREGGAREWVSRALIAAYFLAHDNQPALWVDICDWTEARTPEEVLDAILFAVHVGLP